MTFPLRPGERPAVSTAGPQTQMTQVASAELWGRMIASVFDIRSTVEGHSQVSPASTRAVFLEDMPEERAPETSLAPGRRLEPVHVHGVADTSLHLCLPVARGHELTHRGWAEPHQYADFGTEFMIYAPGSHDELAVVLGIVRESLAFARSAT